MEDGGCVTGTRVRFGPYNGEMIDHMLSQMNKIVRLYTYLGRCPASPDVLQRGTGSHCKLLHVPQLRDSSEAAIHTHVRQSDRFRKVQAGRIGENSSRWIYLSIVVPRRPVIPCLCGVVFQYPDTASQEFPGHKRTRMTCWTRRQEARYSANILE